MLRRKKTSKPYGRMAVYDVNVTTARAINPGVVGEQHHALAGDEMQ